MALTLLPFLLGSFLNALSVSVSSVTLILNMQYKQPTFLQVRHLGHFKPRRMEVFGHLLVGTVYFAALSIACWPDIIFDLPFASIAVLDGRAGSIHAMGGCDREQRSLICNDNSPDDCYKTRNDHSKHRTAFHSAAAD